jgi:hypothetical protein
MDGKHNILHQQGDQPLTTNVLPRCALYVHPTVMAKTQWYQQHKYDGVFVRAEDLELWCRLASQTKTCFGKLDEPLLYYRMNAATSLQKTLYSFRTHRQIVNIYGPKLIGTLKSKLLIGELHLKSLFHQVTAMLGVRDRFIRRNAITTDTPELRQAQATLNQVLQTNVPGWESIQKQDKTPQSQTTTRNRAA